MRILFDQGTPVPLRRYLPSHVVDTAFERGWSALHNGALLDVAEQEGYALRPKIKQSLFDRACIVRNNCAMVQVSVEEIQRDLSAYLRRVEAGETLIIVRAGQPVAEVKPVIAPAKVLRPYGLCAGEFTVPEDFDAPLPEDLLHEFEDP